MSVSFCLPHPVAVSAFMICRGLCACTEMLWMCVLYVSFGSKVRPRTFGCVAMGSALLFVVLGCVCVVYPLPWPLLVGGVRCSRLWSTSQLLRPSGQQCSHSGGVCPQIQGRQCGAVEEMMCVVCEDVTEGA